MVFRVNKTTDYTVMSNYHLREKEMSLKAKGLLSWMLSNDDNWDYSIAGIISNCKENETSIRSALKELESFGYLQIKKCNPDQTNPTIHYIYIVHERSILQDAGFLYLENQDLENQDLENQGQRNIEIRNTKKEEIKNQEKVNPKSDFLGSAPSISCNTKSEKIAKFMSLYDLHCKSLSKVKALTDTRKSKILKIISKYSWDDIVTVFDLAEGSDFLKGDNDRGWKATFDFIIREDKFINILEGKYGGVKKMADGLVLAPKAKKKEESKYEYF